VEELEQPVGVALVGEHTAKGRTALETGAQSKMPEELLVQE
jgi:hypothetical protein